jgi:molybdate transport system ATP-binding protein
VIEVDIHKKLLSASGAMELDVSFSLEQGAFTTLFGKSGAGKTSLLRIIAGLLEPDSGTIRVQGATWFDSANKRNLAPQRRLAGLLFQDYALFPNMTVREQLHFALNKGQKKGDVEELIDIMELGDLQHRRPETLSGGQRQRAALARALVQRPEVLLLDEPFSSLDTAMRVKLQDHVLTAHREYGFTTILVSHDMAEIVKTSEQVLVLDHGKIVRKGSPVEVFTQRNVSGKFQFTGEIIEIQKQDFICILTLIIGSDIVRVVADEKEAEKLMIGDKVLVASKAFNPVIYKLT